MDEKERVTFTITIVSMLLIALCTMAAICGITHQSLITIAVTQEND